MKKIKLTISEIAVKRLEEIYGWWVDKTCIVPTGLKRVTDKSYVDEVIKSIESKDIAKELKEKLIQFYTDLAKKELKRLKAIEINYDLTKEDDVLDAISVDYNLLLADSITTDFKKEVARVISVGYRDGLSIESMTKSLKDALNVSYTRAETIAITETANYSSIINRKALKEFGITKVIWSSARDKRTRKCHLAREGKEYDLTKGCYSSCDKKWLQVGSEVRCRCAMILLI